MCSSWYQRGYSEGVLEAEVGGEVDDVADLAHEVGHDRLRGAVGQPQEHQVEAVGQRGVGLGEDEVGVGGGQAGVEAGGQGAGLRVGRGQGHLELRVPGAQAQQLGAGEPRRPDDPHSCGHSMIIRRHA